MTPLSSRKQRPSMLFAAVADRLSGTTGIDSTESSEITTNEQGNALLIAECHSVSIPSLSLSHDKSTNSGSNLPSSNSCLSSSSQSRAQAEKHAISLLDRPLELSCNNLSDWDDLIRQNVYVSFAVLVDSRLHAYAAFLARHALALEKRLGASSSDSAIRSIEDKLTAILSTGAQVTADSLRAKFELLDDNDMKILEKTSEFKIMQNIRLNVSIDFGITQSNGIREIVPISFSILGTMTGISDSNDVINEVVVKLDTEDLLRKMIEQASNVVTAIIDVASKPALPRRSSNLPNQSIPRSASFLAMPPPPPSIPKSLSSLAPLRSGHPSSDFTPLFGKPRAIGLDLLSQAASELPIVSPDISGSPKPIFTKVPNLDLTAGKYDNEVSGNISNEEDDDMSYLSLDQCADIVDTCLGVEFRVTPEPPPKRTKLF